MNQYNIFSAISYQKTSTNINSITNINVSPPFHCEQFLLLYHHLNVVGVYLFNK